VSIAARVTPLSPVVIGATFTGLALIGMMVSSVGPALGSIQARYGVTEATVGLLGSAQFAGAITGNLSPGWWPKASAGALLGGGLGLFGLACLGLALSNVWALTLVIAFLCGLGFGTFQVHYAAMFSRGFGARSGALMSLMGVAFGLGAIFGPAVIGVIGAGRYAWLLGSCGTLALMTALTFVRMRFAPEPGRTVTARAQGSSRKVHLALIGFVLLSLTYVAAEVTVGFWGATHLREAQKFSPDGAAFLLSFFWIALTVGRALSAPLALRVHSQNIILGGLVLAFLSLLLVQVTPFGYVLAGLFFAPVFPAGLVWLGAVTHDGRATSAFLVASSVGSLVSTPMVGALTQTFGAHIIPWAITGFTVLALASVLWLRGLTKDV
jgi:MFS transporter, FHS family, glucose/mannose:H+ symporter